MNRKIPEGVVPKTPFPHQEAGAERLARKRCDYIAWGPRTGKTLTATLALDKRNAESVLVVCPVLVMDVWATELSEHGWDVGIIRGTRKAKAEAACKDAVIVNYESAWRIGVDPSKFDVLILDEVHRLSNMRAKQTDYMIRAPKCGATWMLSGTPMVESPLQLAGQFFSATGSFRGYNDPGVYLWQNWYWDEQRRKMQPVNLRHPQEIRDAFDAYASFKDASELGMPEKLYELLEVVMDRKDLERLHQATEDTQSEEQVAQAQQRAAAGWNANEAAMEECAKSRALVGYCIDLVATRERALVTCRFVAETWFLGNELKKSGLRVGVINGGVAPTEREEIRKQLAGGHLDVVVAQVITVAEGIDLSAANTHLFYSNDWSGRIRAQVEDRTRNVSKKTPSRIIDVVACDVDRAITRAVRGKENYNAKLLKGEKK